MFWGVRFTSTLDFFYPYRRFMQGGLNFVVPSKCRIALAAIGEGGVAGVTMSECLAGRE